MCAPQDSDFRFCAVYCTVTGRLGKLINDDDDDTVTGRLGGKLTDDDDDDV